MLLTRNGRFNSDAFYTEAQSISQDNAYNNALLTQIKNALKTDFNIDESLLEKLERRYMSKGQLPKDVIAKYVKKATTPAAPSETPATPSASSPAPAAAAQPKVQQTPQAQQSAQGGKTTWEQLKTMASKGQQFIFNNTAYNGKWYLFKSTEPANFFGFPAPFNDGSYQVYPNPAWFRPDNEPFYNHYDDINAAFEGVIKNGKGGAVTNIAPAIFAPDNSIEGKQKGRYVLIEKGIIEQEPYKPQK